MEKAELMKMEKEELIKDLKFCQELMDRLVKFADTHYIDCIYDNKHTVIQRDIIRLRRELNEIRNKLDQ
jgi:hypothetical protein